MPPPKKSAPSSRGGKRPGSGRKPADGIARPAQVNIRTTHATAEWFATQAATHGGTGPALEHIHRTLSDSSPHEQQPPTA